MYSQRAEALQLAYTNSSDYKKGIVQFATIDNRHQFKEIGGCYAEDLIPYVERLLHNNKYRNINLYFTNNLFKSFKGRVENLYSYNSLVIDIDCHSTGISISQTYTMAHSLASALCKELPNGFPMMNLIHYTGRGLHLWWCFDQVSTDLKIPYRITQVRFIELLKIFLSEHSEFSDLKVDETSKKETGYYRLFDTFNTEAEKTSLVVVQNDTPYKLQNLIDAVKTESPYINNSANSSADSSCQKKSNWNSFIIQNRKRMNLIEDLIKDRNAPVGSETRNNYLYVYYNAARGIYSSDMAQKKTENVNLLFHEPLRSLNYIFKEIDARYEKNDPYFFKNSTLIEWFSITEDEQEKYNFHEALKGSLNDLVHNRTRDAERKARREFKECRIISLYLEGMTQAEVAIESGYSIATVKRLLKKKNINRKEERIKKIQFLKAEGYIQTKVAAILEIGIATVKRYWNYAPLS